jgi:hypothetical protein
MSIGKNFTSVLEIRTVESDLKCEVIRVEYAVAGDPEPDFWYKTVMKVVVIRDGTESCHVAFLPCHVVARAHEVIHLDGKFAQVLERYEDDGAGPTRNAKSWRNHGMASYCLLDGIPEH